MIDTNDTNDRNQGSHKDGKIKSPDFSLTKLNFP